VFNIADVAIVAGVALLMYESVFLGERDSRRGKA
jgi:lipoprotein signal peptidase